MYFEIKFDAEPINVYQELVERIAIRGIIIHKEKILLLETIKGDLKFPGGGLKISETFEECLDREIKEETGYINIDSMKCIGCYVQRRYDTYNPRNIFKMSSYYYLCNVRNLDRVNVQLEDYEKELLFQSKWVTIEEAIQQNLRAMSKENANEWVGRELVVLTQLKTMRII